MRSRFLLLALFIVAGSFALPHLAHAAGVLSFDPIIPPEYNVCPAGWGLLITVVNNIIRLLLTLMITFVAPLMIAYAGFLLVVNRGDPGAISKARGIFTNIVVGLVVSFSAWMIIDWIMAALYNPSDVGGTWSSLISGGGDACLPQRGALPGENLNQALPGQTGVITTPTGSDLLSFGGGPCSASNVQSAAAAGGYTLTQAQANTFACLAKPESACGSANPYNYSWNKDTGNGKASTAFGAFQVTLSGNHSCFENSACYRAAGVSGPLDCQKGFDKNGFTSGGDSKVLSQCVKAASNITCNTAAASCVFKKQGFSAWTADAKSATQKACITTYNI